MDSPDCYIKIYNALSIPILAYLPLTIMSFVTLFKYCAQFIPTLPYPGLFDSILIIFIPGTAISWLILSYPDLLCTTLPYYALYHQYMTLSWSILTYPGLLCSSLPYPIFYSALFRPSIRICPILLYLSISWPWVLCTILSYYKCHLYNGTSFERPPKGSMKPGLSRQVVSQKRCVNM